jgi:glutamyl/glutaminyl-tRNA synthetase
MSLEELVEKFDYRRINKSPAVFDYTKLRWMNGEYLKKMDDEKFFELALPYMKEVIKKDLDLHKISAMIKTRIEIWPDIAEMIEIFMGTSEENKRFASGEAFVNSSVNPDWQTYKYAQRYVSLARATAALKQYTDDKTAYNNMKFFEGSENPVVAFIKQYNALANK